MSSKINLRNFLNRLRNAWFTFPLLLLMVMMIAYALYLPQMGYYWDDWEALYFSRQTDLLTHWEFFKFDRPFTGLFYGILYPLLGVGPLRWQLLSLVLRYLAVLGFYYSLTLVWSGKKSFFQISAILWAIYPGFSQQPIAISYSNKFFSLALLMGSFLLMLKAIRDPKRRVVYTIIALLFSLLQCLLVEYFVLLELLRVPLLFFYYYNSHHGTENCMADTVKKSLVTYLPYGVVFMLFVAFRFVFYESLLGIENTNQALFLGSILRGDVGAMGDLIQLSLQDAISILLYGLKEIVTPESIQAKPQIYLSFGMAAAITVLCLAAIPNKISGKKDVTATAQLALFSLAAFLTGALPIWLMGRQTFVGRYADRFVLGPMLGAVLLITLFVFWLGKSSRRAHVVMCVLIGVTAAYHVRNSAEYQQEWEDQRSFYWQLYWRAPDLESGTLVVSPSMPVNNSFYAVGFGLNFLYDDRNQSIAPQHWFVNISRDYGDDASENLSETSFVNSGHRTVHYVSTMAKAIGVVHTSPTGRCLRVIDKPYDQFAPLGEFGAIELALYRLSKPDQWIDASSANKPPRDIFGDEPSPNWCFYFQKADLARQNRNWDQVISLWHQAKSSGYVSDFDWEYLPFLEAFAAKEDWASYEQTALQACALSELPYLATYINHTLENQQDNQEVQTLLGTVAANCPQP